MQNIVTTYVHYNILVQYFMVYKVSRS